PEAHYLEVWGDIRGHDGTVSIQQPLIAPLHEGKSAIELIAAFTAAPAREGLDIVKATWRAWYGTQAPKREAPFEVFWQESVRRGTVADTAFARASADLATDEAGGALPPTRPTGDFEIIFRADPTIHDGRFANNGWLQELPKPLTKISWDNAAFVSPATAKKI